MAKAPQKKTKKRDITKILSEGIPTQYRLKKRI